MELFAVFKEGAFRHECGGIFDDQAKAIAAAREFALGETDGYHSYDVVPFTLNVVSKRNFDHRDHLVESEPLFSTDKYAENGKNRGDSLRARLEEILAELQPHTDINDLENALRRCPRNTTRKDLGTYAKFYGEELADKLFALLLEYWK